MPCQLREDYTEEQIASCVTFLQAQGVPSSGTPCHSPMAYLAKAMDDVLNEVNTSQAKESRRVRRQQLEVAAERERKAAEAREVEGWRLMELQFQETYRDEASRAAAIADLCRGSPFSAG